MYAQVAAVGGANNGTYSQMLYSADSVDGTRASDARPSGGLWARNSLYGVRGSGGASQASSAWTQNALYSDHVSGSDGMTGNAQPDLYAGTE